MYFAVVDVVIGICHRVLTFGNDAHVLFFWPMITIEKK
jgi:hypothetical protein